MTNYLKLSLSDELIELNSTKLNVLQVENLPLFKEIVSFIYYGRGEEDLISLFKDSERIDIDTDVFFIMNIVEFDLNSKKNLNSLNKLLLNTYYESLQEDLDQLKIKMLQITKKLSLELDVSLDIKETIKTDDLFKIMDIKFKDNYDSSLQRFLNYLFVISELQKKTVFFVLHLKEYFSINEIETIIKECSLHEIILIDIESNEIVNLSNIEKKIIVDKDCCLIF